MLNAKETNKIENNKFASLISVTEVKLTVKARSDKSPLPAHLKGLKKLTRTNCSVGNEYENSVNNKLDKIGFEKNFEAVASTISLPDPESKNGIIRMGIKDNSKKYLRVYFFGSEKCEVFYQNENGEIVNPTEKEMEDFFPPKTESKKQADHGLDGKDQIVVREYKVENILYFQCGDVVYNNIPKSILKIFNLELV